MKPLSQRNRATLRRLTKTADKYGLLYLFYRYNTPFLESVARGRKLTPMQHEIISDGCKLAREQRRQP